jgi:hypothetical protein
MGRADDGGMVFHVLNRASARATIFERPEEYAAFERNRRKGSGLNGTAAYLAWSYGNSILSKIRRSNREFEVPGDFAVAPG